MSKEYGGYETNPMTVMFEFMESEEFKDALFDPDDVSLKNLSDAVTKTGVDEELGHQGFLTEFHIGYKYCFYLGIPEDAYLQQLGVEGYEVEELQNRVAEIEKHLER